MDMPQYKRRSIDNLRRGEFTWVFKDGHFLGTQKEESVQFPECPRWQVRMNIPPCEIPGLAGDYLPWSPELVAQATAIWDEWPWWEEELFVQLSGDQLGRPIHKGYVPFVTAYLVEGE